MPAWRGRRAAPPRAAGAPPRRLRRRLGASGEQARFGRGQTLSRSAPREQFLHAADRVALLVEALPDARSSAILRPVIAPPAAALQRFHCGNFDSQKRSTCAGRSSSSATSLIVRNAAAACWPAGRRRVTCIALGRPACVRCSRTTGSASAVDLVLQRMAGAKHQDAARADRHFLAGLRIAADALAFLAHRKAAEGRDLDHLAALQRIRDLGDHRLDQFGRFVARQSDLLIDRFAELSARNRMPGHRPLPAFGEGYSGAKMPSNSKALPCFARPDRVRLADATSAPGRAPGQPAAQVLPSAPDGPA